jgi:chromosome segregation ATPase
MSAVSVLLKEMRKRITSYMVDLKRELGRSSGSEDCSETVAVLFEAMNDLYPMALYAFEILKKLDRPDVPEAGRIANAMGQSEKGLMDIELFVKKHFQILGSYNEKAEKIEFLFEKIRDSSLHPDELGEVIEQLERQLAANIAKEEELVARHTELTELTQDYEDILEEVHNECDDLQNTYASLFHRRVDAEQKKHQLEVELAEIRKLDARSLEEEICIMEKVCEEGKRELTDKRKQFDTIEKKSKQLSRDLEDLRKQLDQAEGSLKTALAQKLKMQKDLDATLAGHERISNETKRLKEALDLLATERSKADVLFKTVSEWFEHMHILAEQFRDIRGD